MFDPPEGSATGPTPQCQALNLSDAQRCHAPATHNTNLFCRLHALQCFGLYKGYKRRNAALDTLAESEPAYLRDSKIALQNQTFEDVTEESQLQEIHSFLFGQYVLLRKVISARKLHHRHFYSLEMDYGHEAYLNKLVSREKAVGKALEALEKRSAEVVFRKEKWYEWVRKEQQQEEEQARREGEVKKKVKMEAALWKRHWGGVKARLEEKKRREEKKREEAYLEEVWRERMAEEEEGAVDWDPIEDVYQDDRERFTDLIRHFLWMEIAAAGEGEGEGEGKEEKIPMANGDGEVDRDGDADGDPLADAAPSASAPAPKKKKKGKRKGKPQTVVPVKETQLAKNPAQSQGKQSELDKSKIESRDEVKKRLKEGVKKEYDHVQGPLVVGSAQLPHELYKKTAPYSEEDAERLVSEIAEIKLLLFCRQILSQSKLLPAALRANSIEEFLADESVADSDLRDLCLKVEQPSLQALRDACADLARGDEPDHDEEEEPAVPPRSAADYLAHSFRYGDLEDSGRRAGQGLRNDLMSLDNRKMFDADSLTAGELKQEPKDRKMKIKVCGKSIWNHASQGSMARDGWLHFCIMAKDCSFPDAMSLCRNWDEFAQLHFLAGWNYFPAPKWYMWSGNIMIEELIGKGFVPFYVLGEAEEETTYNHLPKVTQKALAACDFVTESRNILCAYMKRNDAASRRFIQYILMSRGEAMILVRDGKTGRIVVAPEEDERWYCRHIPGAIAPPPGNATSGHEDLWATERIDPTFFAKAQSNRAWTFGFDAYYEVYIWQNAPGQEISSLYRLVSDSLWKAHKVRGVRDKYKIQKHIIQGLTRDKKTMAARPIRPGEDAVSLFDEVTGPDVVYWMRTKYGKMVQTNQDIPTGESPYLFYNESDEAEDAILFEDGLPDHFPFIEISNPLLQFETSGMSPSILNYQANILHKSLFPEKPLASESIEDALSEDDDSAWESDNSIEGGLKPYAPGSEEFNYYLSPLWAQAHREITRCKNTLSLEKRELLRKLDFDSVRLQIPYSQLTKMMSPLEVMERDRSFIFKDTFHLSDLEEGAQAKYEISSRLLRGVQKFVPAKPKLDWPWFCMEVLDWINLKLYYKKYAQEPIHPWPHRYMVQDITQAFVIMALFFPKLPVTSVVHAYLDTKEGSEFKNSPIFDLVGRSKTRPTCRSRTSNQFQPPSFWEELEQLKRSKKAIYEVYPMDWAIRIRTTIAKLYRGGAIAPAPFSPDEDICTGLTASLTEPGHSEPEMYIKYHWKRDFRSSLPANYIDYTEWPDLLAVARPFAASNPNARFALIKLWSAPHFYPLMLQTPSRLATAFIDPSGRSWIWKFLPKDMPASEWSIHNTVRLRLGALRQSMMGVSDAELARAAAEKAAQSMQDTQRSKNSDKKKPPKEKSWWDRQYLQDKKKWDNGEKWKADEKWGYGHCELDERVFHRGDLILVMGVGEEDLLKWCTAVTFALQTKPWFREVDLWKSFINVDLEFLEGLDKFYLGWES